jgi:hypothetical protein
MSGTPSDKYGHAGGLMQRPLFGWSRGAQWACEARPNAQTASRRAVIGVCLGRWPRRPRFRTLGECLACLLHPGDLAEKLGEGYEP